MDDRIYTYFIPLPDGVNEAVLTCNDGYTIYIDPRQSKDGVIRSYQHALKHIYGCDFQYSDIQEIESKAHAE